MSLNGFNKEEIELIRYGLALISEEVCNKINNTNNKVNNIKLIGAYKNQLMKIKDIDKKLTGGKI